VKLARFDDDRTGILLAGDRLVDLAASAGRFPGSGGELSRLVPDNGYVDWIPLIEEWDRLGETLTELADWAERDGSGAVVKDVSEVRLLAPLPSHNARVFALGANFRSHVAAGAKAAGLDESMADRLATEPLTGFFVIPGTTLGPEEAFTAPEAAELIDYEAEAAAVLASGGRNAPAGSFRFWGYTGWNDLSIRDPHLGVGLSSLDRGTLTWALQKNWEGGSSCGVYMVVDEGQPEDVRLVSRVNGEVRQDGSTSEMVRSFGDGAAYLSQFLTLRPGDVILSGTPAGTAIEQGRDGPYLKPGDVVEVEAGDAGVLRTTRAG
jgi:2-keto-4-pentenoate hydratase/2-oxohepta-3-ene-1,7-dioic acid hydratase in catechol pathway